MPRERGLIKMDAIYAALVSALRERGADETTAPCNRHGDLDLACRRGTLAPGRRLPLRRRSFRCGAASPADRGRRSDRHGRCGRRPTGTVSGIVLRPDLESAVAVAYRCAKPGGVVLLSPAAPSFGQFRDYRDRGEAFGRAMRAIP